MATSAAGATLYLILVQVASRALTFVGNQVLLRYLSPALLGVAVQLDLLSVTVLYFARESLRVALQRQPDPSLGATTEDKESLARQRSQSTVNLSYLAIVLGLLLAPACGLWYLRVADSAVLQSSDFHNSFLVYALATVIELLAEPSFLVIQQHALYAARAKAETTAAIARCASACVTAAGLNKAGYPPSVLPFAVGQLNYTCALFVFYFLAANRASRKGHFRLLPVTINASGYTFSLLSKSSLTLASTMYMQSVFKLFLTQGDALILSVLSSLADQGAFALAANYGGLLARLVFQPVEESSRNIFGRLLSQEGSPNSLQTNARTALSHLSSIIHFYLLTAPLLLSLAPPLIPLLTPYLFSPAFRTPAITSLLATYIYYIPFMAMNGILDSFAASTATAAQLRRQSLWMAFFTALYGLIAWLLLQKLHLGAPGLVWANITNMSLRIAWSVWFIHSWIKQHDKTQLRRFWTNCLPHPSLFVTAVIFQVITQFSTTGIISQSINPDLNKLGMVVGQAALFAGVILIFERDFLISTIHTIIPQRLASKIPFFTTPKPPPHSTIDTDKKKKDL